MRLTDFLQSWDGVQQENRWWRCLVFALLLLLMLMAIKLLRKETVVALQPVTLTQEAWVTKNQASQSYKEAWGLFLAELTGNVTPGTVGFIEARLKPLLAPAIYHEVIRTLKRQVEQIQHDQVTLRFEPRTVEYEAATDTVFVYGYAFEKGASSEAHRRERSYEYRIQIAHYAPLIQFIDTYEGKPRTQKVRAQLKHRNTDQEEEEEETHASQD